MAMRECCCCCGSETTGDNTREEPEQEERNADTKQKQAEVWLPSPLRLHVKACQGHSAG